MQVLSYEAHNVLGVKEVQFDLAGRHLFLVGGANGQGKSSALTALTMALAGKSGMEDYPEIALRKGEKKGKVTIELSGDEELMETESITVELSLRQRASGKIIEEFQVLDSAGEPAPEPRTLLKRLFQLRAFDPLAFERMKPKEKATLVQEMLGLDLAKYDAERKKVYDERTILGREGKAKAAKLEGMEKYKDAPESEVIIADIMSAITEVEESIKERGGVQTKVKRANKELQDLEDKEASLAAKLIEIEADLASVREGIKSQKKTCKKFEKELSGMADRSDEIPVLRERITTAEEVNRKVRANQQYAELEADLKASRKEYAAKTERINEIDEERADEVANAEWPVDGMELTEEGLMMNGLPFEQASTSQRIMASVRVGMALNPKLRLLVCQHGSELDRDTLDALGKIAEEEDFQLLIELVTRSEEDEERCAVLIQDGKVLEPSA